MSNSKIVLEDSAVEFLQEEIGGGSIVVANPTLVGDEPDLTGLQVGDSKYKVPQGPNIITVAYIDRLTDEQCSALRCGDIVIEDNGGQKPRPRFRYKQTFIVTQVNITNYVGQKPTIILSYQQPNGSGSNAINCQSVVYQLDNEQWSCVANKFFDLQNTLDDVFLEGDSGNIPLVEFQPILEKGYCGTDYGMGISIGWDEEKDTPKLSTVVQDNKYYTVSFTRNEPESEEDEPSYSYVITEHMLSGGIEFVEIDIDATSINQETLNKLVDFNNNTLKPNFIVLTTESETDTFPILMPSDNLQYIYRSTVSDGKYYQLTLNIYEEPTGADIYIEKISVGGGDISPIAIFDISDYSTDAELEPSQWNNRMIYEACQNSICLITYTLHNQMAFVSYADFSSDIYTFKLTGSTIEPRGLGGFGWNQENQRFFRASDPK